MLYAYAVLATLTAFVGTAHADSIYCNATNSCPEDAPCCNQFGECGTGSYCLGGCHPLYSYDIDACMPMPVCKNISTTFDDKDSIMSVNHYLGDPDDADWVYSGYLEDYNDANLLAMPNHTSGTVVSSTRFLWYGKVTSTFKTSRGNGVISAFILFSNAQDEIDWEFVGYNLTAAESNYYYQAVLNYTNVETIGTTDTFANYHTYEVDWKEDELKWSLDGEVVRTIKKEETWNDTTESYHYPQTPSRVQFSLWPAGDSNSIGTMEWAGGQVDWDSEDIKDYGYYYFILKNASIECYDPPSGTLINGDNAYVFNSSSNFDQDAVMITDNSTVLCDSDSTGLDNDEDECDASSSTESDSSSDSDTSTTTKSKTSTKTTSGDDESTTTTSRKKSSKSTSTVNSAQVTQFFQNSEQTTTGSTNLALAVSAAPILSIVTIFLSLIFCV
ncbi:CYFA0S01e13850g1_1 [Cyberlindnera fabianii]|uniref:Crh-like protein n=1 Tax=Cyberlindnera fabianii TaxID=36022 RepID=A0A061AJ73_CYBFA|nr:CYFA0S01e13850g1_1 [Cyberlindnera fabianii]